MVQDSVQDSLAEVARWWESHRFLQIVDRISTGILTENFHVRHAMLCHESDFVLRRLHRHLDDDHELVRRFTSAMLQAGRLLDHPNVMTLYEFGELRGASYVLMGYVRGTTLRSWLRRSPDATPLPLGVALDVVAGVAAGLDHAGTQGIVHHGVSPSNLVVREDPGGGFLAERGLGFVKLVDFGIARLVMARPWRDLPPELAEHRDEMFEYLSPEACRGEAIDPRADLFALGIVMWELLIGERLYRRGSVFDTLTAITDEPPRRPSSLRRELPREIDDLVLRLLAKSVDERFQTAAEVIEAIGAFRELERAVPAPAAPDGLYR